MRRVDRTGAPCPKSLAPTGTNAAELAAVKAHIALVDPDKKAFGFGAYKKDDVKRALESLFHGKCAYCETLYAASAPVDVEHYRPKGAVAEEPTHEGYWWIAMAWDNLLPSCIDCNRKRGQEVLPTSTSLVALATNAKPIKAQAGKKDSFPLAVGGTRATCETDDLALELPLLLNPCVDDPHRSLGYKFDPAHPAGLILPVGDAEDRLRGAVSIQVYGLNRLKLVQDRTRILRRLEFLGDLVIDLSASIAELEDPSAVVALAATPARGVASRLRLLRDRTLAEMKDLGQDTEPYSSMVRAWLGQFKARVQAASAGTP